MWGRRREAHYQTTGCLSDSTILVLRINHEELGTCHHVPER